MWGHGREKKIFYEWKNAGEIAAMHREQRLRDRLAAELRHGRTAASSSKPSKKIFLARV